VKKVFVHDKKFIALILEQGLIQRFFTTENTEDTEMKKRIRGAGRLCVLRVLCGKKFFFFSIAASLWLSAWEFLLCTWEKSSHSLGKRGR
jgi:hypothetical protein